MQTLLKDGRSLQPPKGGQRESEEKLQFITWPSGTCKAGSLELDNWMHILEAIFLWRCTSYEKTWCSTGPQRVFYFEGLVAEWQFSVENQLLLSSRNHGTTNTILIFLHFQRMGTHTASKPKLKLIVKIKTQNSVVSKSNQMEFIVLTEIQTSH